MKILFLNSIAAGDQSASFTISEDIQPVGFYKPERDRSQGLPGELATPGFPLTF
jgi:hypothetical protein